jgi:hypothetical protein
MRSGILRQMPVARAQAEPVSARARVQIAFGDEPLEDIERGLARDPELRGEIARGRQPRVRGEPAFDDARAQLAVDLAGEIATAVQGDVNVQGQQRPT